MFAGRLHFRGGPHFDFLCALRRIEGEIGGVHGCGEIPGGKGDAQLRLAGAMEGGDEFARELIIHADPQFREARRRVGAPGEFHPG